MLHHVFDLCHSRGALRDWATFCGSRTRERDESSTGTLDLRDLQTDGRLTSSQYWWLCYLAYTLTMLFAKISIGFFLLRVTVVRIQRQVIYCAVCTTVVVGIVFLFVTVFQCSPVSYFWDRAQDGHCLGMDVIIGLTYFYSVVNAICDFTFGLLPVFLVWNLHMDRRVKIILIPILGMGCVLVRYPPSHRPCADVLTVPPLPSWCAWHMSKNLPTPTSFVSRQIVFLSCSLTDNPQGRLLTLQFGPTSN